MNRIVEFNPAKRKVCSDVEVVDGLASHNSRVEEWFYASAKRYFNEHFREVFFDLDRKQEIFQTAFLKIWTEIENGRIAVKDGVLVRRQTDGTITPMTCSLNTFVMAYAKNEYRELVRNVKECSYDELIETGQMATPSAESVDDDDEEFKNRIVDECIQQISPSCADILTMFYYEGKSLDEILELRKDKNSSKNGLKTAKNKCMNTLRDMIAERLTMYNIVI